MDVMGEEGGQRQGHNPTKASEAALDAALSEGRPIVLFDGVCALCNGFVNFAIDHDPKRHLRFASLQSSVGETLLDRHGLDHDLSTVVLVQGDQHYTRSGAALRVLRYLSMPWPILFYMMIIIPWFLRDIGYKFVAAVRYRLFGKEESCRMPTPEFKARFLDWNEHPVNAAHCE